MEKQKNCEFCGGKGYLSGEVFKRCDCLLKKRTASRLSVLGVKKSYHNLRLSSLEPFTKNLTPLKDICSTILKDAREGEPSKSLWVCCNKIKLGDMFMAAVLRAFLSQGLTVNKCTTHQLLSTVCNGNNESPLKLENYVLLVLDLRMFVELPEKAQTHLSCYLADVLIQRLGSGKPTVLLSREKPSFIRSVSETVQQLLEECYYYLIG